MTKAVLVIDPGADPGSKQTWDEQIPASAVPDLSATYATVAQAVRGVQSAPAVPSSAAPLTSPFAFACLVTIRGTVSVLVVGGVTLPLLGSLVLVPGGATIAITYLSAPTWTWYGLA